MADERKTIRRYLVVGLVILVVIGLACYDLWMRVERQFYRQMQCVCVCVCVCVRVYVCTCVCHINSFYSQGLHATGMPKVGGKANTLGAGGGILGTLFPPPSKRGPSAEPSVSSSTSSRMPSSEASQ